MIETLSWKGEKLPIFERAPSAPHGHAPLRRPGSARRTSSIEVHWPEGRWQPGVYHGRARDIITPVAGGAPILMAEDSILCTAQNRVIQSVTSTPPRASLPQLVGARAGGHLRDAIDRVLHEERVAGTPLYLLLDDLAGATLVSGWAYFAWPDDKPMPFTAEELAAMARNMESVCIGFRPESTALGSHGQHRPEQNATKVVPLPNPADLEGWHPLVDRGPVNFRRARRVDVWREGDLIKVDSMFQDSGSHPDGGRIAIHEYRLTATADADGILIDCEATPGTLPYKECPAATANVGAMVGTPLKDLRAAVLIKLRKTAGCTHLNDALRALAEVPRLAGFLPEEAIA